MTVLIYFTGSSNLRVILTQLQPQLRPSDDIYLVDTTPKRDGVRLAALYGSTRCFIFVEVGKYSKWQALEFATQSMKDNKQDGLLVIDENCIISQTLVSNMRKVKGFDIVSPVAIRTPYPQFPSDFKWYNPTSDEVRKVKDFSEHCFFTKEGIIGGGQASMGVLVSETVIVLPLS